MTTLWVMGNLVGGPECWTMGGVFDSERKAIDACQTANDFIGPVTLNEQAPCEPTPWPGAYFPLADEQDAA